MSSKIINKRTHIETPILDTEVDILDLIEKDAQSKPENIKRSKPEKKSLLKDEIQKIAIFPGTFDPFTLGHQSVVDRGLALFDKIIIAIGINESKRGYFSIEQRIKMIKSLFLNNPKIEVDSYNILTVDYATKVGAGYILRGIRSVNDFEYEKTIADVNRELSGVETIIFFTEPKYTHISSTIVRELIRYKKDVSGFVPSEMNLDSYVRNNY